MTLSSGQRSSSDCSSRRDRQRSVASGRPSAEGPRGGDQEGTEACEVFGDQVPKAMNTDGVDTSWIAQLSGDVFLAVQDVVLDIRQELQFGSDVVIPILPAMVRFRQLMPADTIDLRDRYSELRWKAANLLKSHGVVGEIEVLQGNHRWESRLEIEVQREEFERVATALQSEVDSRRKAGPAAMESVTSPLEHLRNLILRFHSVAVQLRTRHDSRTTLDVVDEYDVQDLLYALLRIYFDDVRPEEWAPSYAGKSARADFLLKPEGIVVECKKTRQGLGAKEIGDQLIVDIARYKEMKSCRTLVCMVYDPENRIPNPGGFQADLSADRGPLVVEVIVVPKRY